MNKKELIKALSENSELNQKQTAAVVDALVEVITQQVVDGEDVKIPGIGTFTSVERAARNGVNPLTGEALSIPAKRVPKLKISSTLKNAIKNA